MIVCLNCREEVKRDRQKKDFGRFCSETCKDIYMEKINAMYKIGVDEQTGAMKIVRNEYNNITIQPETKGQDNLQPQKLSLLAGANLAFNGPRPDTDRSRGRDQASR